MENFTEKSAKISGKLRVDKAGRQAGSILLLRTFGVVYLESGKLSGVLMNTKVYL